MVLCVGPWLETMTTALRTLVSQNRQRYVDEEIGVNLDLAYITDRLIAMSFPGQKVQALYRNDLREVKKFLDSKHNSNYKVYNLCSEMSSRFKYCPSLFDGRMVKYSMPDHFPPKFELIVPFCEDVDKWLGEDAQNVAVIHCKAGKGRTGTMICCYLLHSGQYKEANDAMAHFAKQRTKDGRGITIPSQIRYVKYFEKLTNDKLIYDPKRVVMLKKVVLRGISQEVTSVLHFQISLSEVCYQLKMDLSKCCIGPELHELQMSSEVKVWGDVKFKVSAKRKIFTRKEVSLKSIAFALEFHACINTFFLEAKADEPSDCKELQVLSLSAKELDDFQWVGVKKEKIFMDLHFDQE